MFAAFGWEVFDAHVVDDEDVAAQVVFHGALVAQGMVGLNAEVGDDFEDGAVEDGLAGFDEGRSDALGEVTLTHSGRTDHEDVSPLFEEGAGGELVDELAVDLGVEAEVGVFEASLFPEAGGFGVPGDLALVTDVEFVGEDEFGV